MPCIGSEKPAIRRRVVVLPQPEEPSRLTNSPRSTFRLKSVSYTHLINSFNNVSLSAFLTGPGVNMLPIEIMGYVEYHFDPTIAALATIMMVATLGVMLLIEKTLGLQSVV